MKFTSRFKVGDKAWTDHSTSYYDLTQCGKDHEGRDIVTAATLTNGYYLIGVTLMEVTIEDIYVWADVNNSGVGYRMNELGTSSRSENDVERGIWATKEEAEYFATKAYLKRLAKVIKFYQKETLKVDDYAPSHIEKYKQNVEILIKYRQSLKEKCKNQPTVNVVTTEFSESKFDINDVVWVLPHSDRFRQINPSCWNEIHDIDACITWLTETPVQVKVSGIRNIGKRFRYSFNNLSLMYEINDDCIFNSSIESFEFAKQNVFIGGLKSNKLTAISSLINYIEVRIDGDISPKEKRELIQRLERLKTLLPVTA